METTARPERIEEEFQKIYASMDQENYEEARRLMKQLDESDDTVKIFDAHRGNLYG